MRAGTIVDATIIAAPSSIKNEGSARDPERHQTKKGNAWHFGMKAHIGVDAQSGLVRTMVGTAANVNDVTQAGALLHGEETVAFGDAGYWGVHKREEAQGPQQHVAMHPGKRRQLDLTRKWARLLEKAEQLNARVRAKSRAPVPCDQEPVSPQEDPLQGPREERGAAVKPVRAGQSRHRHEVAVDCSCPRCVLNIESGLTRGAKRSAGRPLLAKSTGVATALLPDVLRSAGVVH